MTNNQRARVTALRLLAVRRLSEAQLWTRLARKGYADQAIRDAVESCRCDGFIDDRLFATLFVEGRTKAVGDARLIAELVRRGIDRAVAESTIRAADCDEQQRLERAIDKLFAARPGIAYPSAARTLERLGFPAARIYRVLRAHAARFGPLAGLTFEDSLAVHA
ncbi:MAG: regulatory protein RecX [Vulcanimicrobiaceae bacterium]